MLRKGCRVEKSKKTEEGEAVQHWTIRVSPAKGGGLCSGSWRMDET